MDPVTPTTVTETIITKIASSSPLVEANLIQGGAIELAFAAAQNTSVPSLLHFFPSRSCSNNKRQWIVFDPASTVGTLHQKLDQETLSRRQ